MHGKNDGEEEKRERELVKRKGKECFEKGKGRKGR